VRCESFLILRKYVLDMLCGVVENAVKLWCDAVEAGPFVMVEGE
jgi:hypothetical protein